jgi:hypothetical protein
MSDKRGVLVSVSGSSLNNVAGINANAAFFAPAISIWPDSDLPPRTTMESMPVILSVLAQSHRAVLAQSHRDVVRLDRPLVLSP